MLPKEDEDEEKKGLLFEGESEFVLEAKVLVPPPTLEEVLDVKPLPEFVLLKPLEVLTTKPLALFEDEDEITFPWGIP